MQEVFALVRPTSMDKPVVEILRQRSVKIREGDLEAPEEVLTKALRGIDVLVSSVRESATQQQDQISLANAAKRAGIKRFVPCGFGIVTSPGGIMRVRDQVSHVGISFGYALRNESCSTERARIQSR
jgi:hypothetical protein